MATAQVQEAARKVLLENRKLRALMATKGVPTAEIEEFLDSYDRNASFTAALPTLEALDVVDTQSQAAPSADLQQPAEMHASNATKQLIPAASPPAMLVDNGFESASQAGKNGELTRSSSDSELLQPAAQPEEDLECGSSLPNIFGPVSDCYCPEVEPAPGQTQSAEMECSAAANILAGFRGHGDVEQARAELGCPDTTQCSITNAALLHVLDSEHTSDIQPYNAHTTATH